MFTKREIKHLIISILVLGFAFGLNDKQAAFNLSSWTVNFIHVLMAAAITLLLYELTHKLVARRYKAETEYEIWSIKRYGFWRSSEFPVKFLGFTIRSLPIGIILSIMATLLSKGLFYLIPMASFRLVERPHLRLGAKFRHVSNFEEAKIAASSLVILAIIALIASSSSALIFSQLSAMMYVFIAWCLIPISQLDGSKIFFGSIPLYIATAMFVLFSWLLAPFGIIISLVLSLIGVLFLVLLYIKKKLSVLS